MKLLLLKAVRKLHRTLVNISMIFSENTRTLRFLCSILLLCFTDYNNKSLKNQPLLLIDSSYKCDFTACSTVCYNYNWNHCYILVIIYWFHLKDSMNHFLLVYFIHIFFNENTLFLEYFKIHVWYLNETFTQC